MTAVAELAESSLSRIGGSAENSLSTAVEDIITLEDDCQIKSEKADDDEIEEEFDELDQKEEDQHLQSVPLPARPPPPPPLFKAARMLLPGSFEEWPGCFFLLQA